MSEEKKPKKQRKATTAAPKNGEHKPSWQEKYASPEEIQQLLADRVLRRAPAMRTPRGTTTLAIVTGATAASITRATFGLASLIRQMLLTNNEKRKE